MKKINLKGLDLTVYQETLPNKLQIYYLQTMTNDKYNIFFTTNYGGSCTSFETNKKKITIPNGTAHYLEHKMFESTDGSNIFDKFSNRGSYCNAFTNEKRTTYLCNGNSNFKDDLIDLIEYVLDPYFTDENIQKEYGIISEEIKRAEDNVHHKLYDEADKNIFNTKEYSQNVLGTTETIKNINKELLYDVYNAFYVPNNMHLLIVGNFDLNEAKNIVKEKLTNMKENNTIKLPEIKEKKEVKRKKQIIKYNTEIDKVDITIKVNTKEFDLPKYELYLYLDILMDCLFSDTSEFFQKVIDNKIVSEFYNYSQIKYDYILLSLYASSSNPEEYIKEVEKKLKNVQISEKDFNRKKKVIIANQIFPIDNPDFLVNILSNDLVNYGRIIPDKIEIIRNLDYKKLNKIINKIDFNNKSVTIIKK